MFSGIVESVQPILSVQKATASQGPASLIRIQVKKPQDFNDLHHGDSIAIDGICLTVENFSDDSIGFALAAETLKILGQNQEELAGKMVNLERSLRFGDRIHGHLVTGHVDSLGLVTRSEALGENWFLDVEISKTLLAYVWRKGSITLNGVALTVNEINHQTVSVCLIPETLKRTNLSLLKVGSFINIEPDYMAKAIQRMREVEKSDEMINLQGQKEQNADRI